MGTVIEIQYPTLSWYGSSVYPVQVGPVTKSTMLTCPNCQHVFDNQQIGQCCHIANQTPSPPPAQSSSATNASFVVSISAEPANNIVNSTNPFIPSVTTNPFLSVPPPQSPVIPQTTCTLSVSVSGGQCVRNVRVVGRCGGGLVQAMTDITPSSSSSSVLTQDNSRGSNETTVTWSWPSSSTTPALLPHQQQEQKGPETFNTSPTTGFGSSVMSPAATLPFLLPTPSMTTPTTPPPCMLPTEFGLLSSWSASNCVVPAETELTQLTSTVLALKASGWYYEGLTWQGSVSLLSNTEPGTFLVRDSSDPRFLFCLSAQTERGPTSVRLYYVCGKFRLDAEARLAQLIPLFDSVISLVDHYAKTYPQENCKTNRESDAEQSQVWVDNTGKMYSHINLTKPLYQTVMPLQHLCRLVVNRCDSLSKVTKPPAVKKYLNNYPYKH